ncbi:hypothetical protein DFH06DRAFT_1122284 [Mycena polygramma]|nr:hypothetical protein DFH06DRAFT_1122284 [Mycena polygramma]
MYTFLNLFIILHLPPLATPMSVDTSQVYTSHISVLSVRVPTLRAQAARNPSVSLLGAGGMVEAEVSQNPDIVQEVSACMDRVAQDFTAVFCSLHDSAFDVLMQCAISALALQERYSLVAACTFLASGLELIVVPRVAGHPHPPTDRRTALYASKQGNHMLLEPATADLGCTHLRAARRPAAAEHEGCDKAGEEAEWDGDSKSESDVGPTLATAEKARTLGGAEKEGTSADKGDVGAGAVACVSRRGEQQKRRKTRAGGGSYREKILVVRMEVGVGLGARGTLEGHAGTRQAAWAKHLWLGVGLRPRGTHRKNPRHRLIG